jgi:hypothetical protein
MNEFVKTILIILVVGFFMKLISKGQKRSPEVLNGNTVLRPSNMFFWSGIASLVIGTSIWLLLFWGINKTQSALTTVSIISLFFLISGAYLCLYTKRYFVKYSNEEVISGSILGKVKKMNWSNINKITFNRGSMYLKLYDGSSTINVYAMTIGFDSFIGKLKEKTDSELYSKAIENIEKMKKDRPDIWS